MPASLGGAGGAGEMEPSGGGEGGLESCTSRRSRSTPHISGDLPSDLVLEKGRYGKNTSLQCFHRITEWFGLEGTFKGQLQQLVKG